MIAGPARGKAHDRHFRPPPAMIASPAHKTGLLPGFPEHN
jgi:hypothetical protein